MSEKPRKKKSGKSGDIDRLYRAAADYVNNRDGKALVAIGVSMIEFPFDVGCFWIAVKLTGRKPKLSGEKRDA